MNFAVCAFAVAAGGALGALARYALASRLDGKFGFFPLGTFCANMLSSFALGIFMGLSNAGESSPLFDFFAQTGFCATLSTFSELAFQIASMLEKRRLAEAFSYALATFLSGVLLFAAAANIFSFRA